MSIKSRYRPNLTLPAVPLLTSGWGTPRWTAWAARGVGGLLTGACITAAGDGPRPAQRAGAAMPCRAWTATGPRRRRRAEPGQRRRLVRRCAADVQICRRRVGQDPAAGGRAGQPCGPAPSNAYAPSRKRAGSRGQASCGMSRLRQHRPLPPGFAPPVVPLQQQVGAERCCNQRAAVEGMVGCDQFIDHGQVAAGQPQAHLHMRLVVPGP